MSALDRLKLYLDECPLVAIIRGVTPDEAEAIAEAGYYNAGQDCTAASRIYVQAGVEQQVPAEIEQESLDAALDAAVVRIDTDRDRGPVPLRLPGVDPVGGHERFKGCGQRGTRVAHRAAAQGCRP